MSDIGANVIAKSLKASGVKVIFGVVGIPVIEVAEACRAEGIQFIAMRNEQSASYAANAYGYLNQTAGVCLSVSGPGFVHALAGLANAQANAWPMLLISGASDVDQDSLGAFQEFPQVEAARLYTKYAARPPSLDQISFFVQKALSIAVSGRPGPCYLDIPGSLIVEAASQNMIIIPNQISPPKVYSDPSQVLKALKMLGKAKQPLFVIGKGAAYSKAEKKLIELIEMTNIPFLPTPMGKGTVSDRHQLCVAAARSLALKEADVIVLFGARLNWMLHFGAVPRFRSEVKFIQIDICPEEFGNGWNTQDDGHIGLVGDINCVVSQFVELASDLQFQDKSDWISKLKYKVENNQLQIQGLIKKPSEPYMSYYNAYSVIKKHIDSITLQSESPFIVGEGANTMDIGRTMIDQLEPRTRLDAGTFGTMGVGLGFAIAAQLSFPAKRVFCIQGDSAFGFGAMELETVCRLQLPIVVIIINNNGIYSGLPADKFRETQHLDVKDLPSTSLLADARYEMIGQAFGATGYCVNTMQDFDKTLDIVLKSSLKMPCVINVLIDPSSVRKTQEHSWLTRSQESKL